MNNVLTIGNFLLDTNSTCASRAYANNVANNVDILNVPLLEDLWCHLVNAAQNLVIDR